MKNKKTVALATLLALFTLAGNLRAQVPMTVNISAKAMIQGSTNDNSVITTTKSPKTYSISTKQLLNLLATAENSEGNYDKTQFPAGSKLVVDPDSGDFQVWDGKNNLLVDVSDIMMSWAGDFGQANYGTDLITGSQNTDTGLGGPTEVEQEVFTVYYDDTYAGGNLQFYLTGMVTNMTTDSVPNVNTGNYKETQTQKMINASGDGNSQATPLVVTGNFSASGSGNLSQ